MKGVGVKNQVLEERHINTNMKAVLLMWGMNRRVVKS